MRSKILLIAALGGLLVALPSAALGGAAQNDGEQRTYADSIGEDATAPDITSVVVSNDDAGMITFKVNISNRPALTADMSIQLVLDTDQLSTTGDPGVPGGDYLIELDPGSVGLFKWNGSDYAFATSQTSLTYAYDATGATIRISAADLGKTKGMNFQVFAASGIARGRKRQPGLHECPRRPRARSWTRPLQLQGRDEAVAERARVHDVAEAGEERQELRRGPRRQRERHGRAGPGGNRHLCGDGLVQAHRPAGSRAQERDRGVRLAPCEDSKGKTIRGTVTVTVQGVKVTRSFTAKIT